MINDFTNLFGGAVCLFMGLVCFVLGIIRAINRLHCKQIILIALFSVLFSLARLGPTDFVLEYVDFQFIDYLYRIAFYTYPIPLFLHFYHYLRPSIKRWMLSPIILLITYGAAVWLMYFIFDLPLDIPHGMYTPISAACAVMLLSAGIFGAESKESARYLRIIAVSWIVWVVYILIKTGMGIRFIIDSDYNITMMLSAAFMTCYMLYINTRELAGSKSEMQMLEMKNEFLLENYQTLETHFTQIAQMKHEMRNHLFAIRTLHENGESEQLTEYLAGMQSSFADIQEPISCNNRIIQAVLTYAAQLARKMGFEIEFELAPMPPLTIPDADIVSLLMNLLNNALESCAKIEGTDQRWIKVRLKHRSPYLYLSILNARQGEIKIDESRYVSAKKIPFLYCQFKSTRG
jgi:signal transduction histidine kinase